jgi:hypothetical protein
MTNQVFADFVAVLKIATLEPGMFNTFIRLEYFDNKPALKLFPGKSIFSLDVGEKFNFSSQLNNFLNTESKLV